MYTVNMDDIFEFKRTRKVAELRIGDCLDVVDDLIAEGIMVDAIITDPPYEISYMAQEWDATGMTFKPETWQRLTAILKPGGFLLAFSSARVYHHLATAIETIGFETYPFLVWMYSSGLPKPMNVSNMFDRDNLGANRTVVGTKRNSGYSAAQIKHGQQNYSKHDFAVYEENVSDEAKQWAGFFYGVNTMKPAIEPIYMGRKPLATPRTIDNLRQHGTGALNIGALREQHGCYPTNVFQYSKARQEHHESDHPTVKPLDLMEDLVALACPSGGRVLDPFAGTGTTGVACQRVGLECILIEQEPQLETVIRRRLGYAA